jgi:hypothetical protein
MMQAVVLSHQLLSNRGRAGGVPALPCIICFPIEEELEVFLHYLASFAFQ